MFIVNIGGSSFGSAVVTNMSTEGRSGALFKKQEETKKRVMKLRTEADIKIHSLMHSMSRIISICVSCLLDSSACGPLLKFQ